MASNGKVKPLLKQALDDALTEHIKLLFAGWLKDDTDQPERAARGARKAIAAWRQAKEAIASMEDD